MCNEILIAWGNSTSELWPLSMSHGNWTIETNPLFGLGFDKPNHYFRKIVYACETVPNWLGPSSDPVLIKT